MSWPAAFALTVAIEVPIVLLLAARGRRRRAAGDAFAANLLTHPCAWWAVLSAGASWWLVEALVAATEALVYRTSTRMTWPRGAATSLVANGCTAAIGFAQGLPRVLKVRHRDCAMLDALMAVVDRSCPCASARRRTH